MLLAERHSITRFHSFFAEIDALAYCSKNVYNRANYCIRQKFIHEGIYIGYSQINNQLKEEECYQALPAKVSQQILRKLDLNWKSFFKAISSYNQEPSKFQARPGLPKYKHKEHGRNLLIYVFGQINKKGKNLGKRESGAISKVAIKKGLVVPSKTKIALKTKVNEANLKECRIIPKYGRYVVEIVYEQEVRVGNVNPDYYAAIDLGVNNLATVTSNHPGLHPFLVNGRPVKSYNQFFNKRKALLQSLLPSQQYKSHRLERLAIKRDNLVENYLHKASRMIINRLVENQISTIIIGHNDGWKQKVNMGKVNNQKFVHIPFNKFIQQLTYKAELVGIKVIVLEESYTSKASFLDGDSIPTYKPGENNNYQFSGKRVERGLYRTEGGRLINADVNGSLNIMKKAFPNAFNGYGIEALVVEPVRINLTN